MVRALLGALFDGTWGDASALLDIIAVAAIVGTVAAYNRLRTALTASDAAGTAWEKERDAIKVYADRLELELKASDTERLALVAKVTALEQRPDLTKLESLVADSVDAQRQHEANANDRTDRLVAAIEALAPRMQ